MVFSEKPAENHHFSQKPYDAFDKPAENYQ